ncbi:ATP-binding protein [Sulfolobus tengchongensis]|uniref:ATP-binding protein n=1 Tax=Sulfolobus tengchongensis TaxID=207809 RepID=A0AAX4L1Y9_9CREN
MEDLVRGLEKKLNEAEEEAKKYGKVIGRITRYETVSVEDNELVGVDIAFEDYLDSDVKKGQYLAIRSIIKPVIMLGQVYSITRADVLARLGLRELTYPKDPTTIITTTYVELKPIAEMEGDKIRPPVSPIDPQSPVFIPNPDLVEKILRIPSNGITIGKIFSGGEEIEAYVRLDEYTLRHHTLIVGTTGSGKTTLLKSIIASDEIEKSTLIFDRQRDFVNFLIQKRKNFAVVMPVVEEANHKISIQDHAMEFANWYGCDIIDVKSDGAYVKCNGSEIFVIPYSINFYDNLTNFHRITPYFTSRASMYWEAIVEKTFDLIKYNLYELLKRYPSDNELSGLLRYRLTPGKLLGNLKISYDLNTTSSLNRDYISYDPKSKTLELRIGKAFHEAMKQLDIASQTREAIVRTLKAYDNYGIFTVPGSVEFLPDKVFSLYDDVVVDLSWVMDKSASVEAVATVAYKILEDFFKWKDLLYKKKQESRLTLVIMDEAHEYFPQTDMENISKDIVEGLMNRIMRLGRVRGIGVILATHVPDDLNPLVIQLSNTKVIMRNETHVLRRLGLDEYEDFLRHATPGLGIVYSISFSEVPIRTVLRD